MKENEEIQGYVCKMDYMVYGIMMFIWGKYRLTIYIVGVYVYDVIKMNATIKKRVFISYAWASKEYQDRVLALATDLVQNGMDI